MCTGCCSWVPQWCRPSCKCCPTSKSKQSNGGGTGVRFCGFQCAWLQPLIVLLLVSYVYCVYVGLNLMPALQLINSTSLTSDTSATFISGVPTFQSFVNDPHATRMSLTSFIITALGFHVLLILFAASFIKTMITPPGSVPVDKMADKKKWDDGLFDISPADDQRIEDIMMDTTTDLDDQDTRTFIRGMKLVERKREKGLPQANGGLKRFCKTCQIYKPDRSHHCKVCGHCVLRMDHHCPWVASCIGFRNYKYFMLILFYAILLTLWVLCTMGERFARVFEPVLNRHQFLTMDVPVGIAYGLTLIAFVGLTVFFGFHVYMATHALTSIERTEKRSSNDEEVAHRFRVAHIKFDQGLYQNWLHVMGPSHSWLFPVDANPEDDGTYSHDMMHDRHKAL